MVGELKALAVLASKAIDDYEKRSVARLLANITTNGTSFAYTIFLSLLLYPLFLLLPFASRCAHSLFLFPLDVTRRLMLKNNVVQIMLKYLQSEDYQVVLLALKVLLHLVKLGRSIA